MSFSDEWLCKRNKQGIVWSAVRSWYVCLCDCKGAWDCCATLILSKTWARKHNDPMASRQVYYCHQGHKYATKYGQLVQLVIAGRSFFMRAEVPDWDIEDIRAINQEEENGWDASTSAEQIFAVAKVASPLECDQSGLLVPIAAHDGHFKITNLEVFKSMPMFPWAQIYTFSGMKVPEKKAKKSRR